MSALQLFHGRGVTLISALCEFLGNLVRTGLLRVDRQHGQRSSEIDVDVRYSGDSDERVTHASGAFGPSGHPSDGEIDFDRFGQGALA